MIKRKQIFPCKDFCRNYKIEEFNDEIWLESAKTGIITAGNVQNQQCAINKW